jgi:hypothetical protein
MNKLFKPSVKLSNVADQQRCAAAQSPASDCRIVGRRAFCSYTNDLARAAKTCQAPFKAKNAMAR